MVERSVEYNPLVLSDEIPHLPVKLMKVTQRKTARAQIRGAAIEIVIPRHWPRKFKDDVAHKLATRLQTQFNRDWKLLHTVKGPRISFTNKKTLEQWVRDLNDRTLQVPLKGVRLGYARYTHLAQMNLRSHVMTVSKHCVNNTPEAALRYLVIHELAHLKVPNHSRAFWAEVERFIPDYKQQRRIIAATHRIRVYEAELLAAQQTPKASEEPLKPNKPPEKRQGLLEQLLLRLF